MTTCPVITTGANGDCVVSRIAEWDLDQVSRTLRNIVAMLEHPNLLSFDPARVGQLKDIAEEIRIHYQNNMQAQVFIHQLINRIIHIAEIHLGHERGFLERLLPELATRVLRFVPDEQLDEASAALRDGAARKREATLQKARELGFEGDLEQATLYLLELEMFALERLQLYRGYKSRDSNQTDLETTVLYAAQHLTGDEICHMISDKRATGFLHGIVKKRSLSVWKESSVRKIIYLLNAECTAQQKRCCIDLLVQCIRNNQDNLIALDSAIRAVAQWGDRYDLQNILRYVPDPENLIWPIMDGRSIDHLRYLFEVSPVPNVRDQDFCTPFHKLAKDFIQSADPFLLEMMDVLHENGGNPYLPDESGMSAMDLIEQAQNEAPRKVLIKWASSNSPVAQAGK